LPYPTQEGTKLMATVTPIRPLSANDTREAPLSRLIAEFDGVVTPAQLYATGIPSFSALARYWEAHSLAGVAAVAWASLP
jgi:hypothetical protein